MSKAHEEKSEATKPNIQHSPGLGIREGILSLDLAHSLFLTIEPHQLFRVFKSRQRSRQFKGESTNRMREAISSILEVVVTWRIRSFHDSVLS